MIFASKAASTAGNSATTTALDDGDMTATGQVIEAGAGAKATLEAVQDEFRKAKFAGIACGIKNTGIGNGMPDSSMVKIAIAAEDKVIIDHGWTEMGQGVHTVAVQALVTETGINPSMIEVRVETRSEMLAGMTTASRATSLIGNAIIDASKALKADLEQHTLAELVGKEYVGEFTVDWTTKPGAMVEKIYTHYSYSYATQVVILDEAGQIEKIIAAHDAGKIFNPTLFEGQLEGSIHMGLGYAISEDLPMEGGRPRARCCANAASCAPKICRRWKSSAWKCPILMDHTALKVSGKSAWCPLPALSPTRFINSMACGVTSCRCACRASARFASARMARMAATGSAK